MYFPFVTKQLFCYVCITMNFKDKIVKQIWLTSSVRHDQITVYKQNVIKMKISWMKHYLKNSDPKAGITNSCAAGLRELIM